jgi:DNA polymerase III subunit alpha
MIKQPIPLHNHSNHSFLDGMSSIKEMLDRAKTIGIDAIAITNHGNIFAIPEQYEECKKRGIKPILGTEAYLTESHDRKSRHAHHIVLLAENEVGWGNIVRLTTRANQNFYYKPRIDLGDLEEFKEGVIVLTACLHGPVSYWLFDKMTWPKEGEESQLKEAANIPEAYRFARNLKRIIGSKNLFLEVQDGGIPEQKIVNQRVRKMAQELDLLTIATQDSHYVYKEDAKAHGFLKAMAFGKSAVEEGSHGFSTDEFYLKTRDEWLSGSDLTEDEVDRTREIANRCNATLALGQMRLPRYPYLDDMTAMELLQERLNEGWQHRNIQDDQQQTYKTRLYRECRDIAAAGLADYFLIVSDITNYCHDNRIMLSPGRGSAGGSLVSFLLGITNLDPIKYKLIWERFYNAGRIGSMPDIDTDVERNRREEVLIYIRERFGVNRVAQIVNLTALGAKAVLKDTFRVAGIDFDTANRISGLVPAKNDDHSAITLRGAVEKVPALKEIAEDDSPIEIKRGGKIIRTTSWVELFEIAYRLEGCYKNTGVHAAAVVIADDDFDKVGIPLVRGATKDELICGWNMDAIDSLGFLKVDILGLTTLSVIKTTLKLIKERHGLDIDINDIPLNDPKVAEIIRDGRNDGVFQIESTLGKVWSRKCKPGSSNPDYIIEEIADLTSLIRPAVLEAGFAESYIRRKSGEEPVAYIHPLLEEILKPTYGVLLYQEQMMDIASQICGWDLQTTDSLRRVVGKKKVEELKTFKERFIQDANQRVNTDIAEQLWGMIENGAGYCFNKAHAMGYGLLAYQTAWLKANYYIEFLCANLIHAKDQAGQQTPQEVISTYINDGKLHNIEVVPPTLDRSEDDFIILNDSTIAFGFSHIKNVGAAAMQAVRACRMSKSFSEFLELAHVHKMNRQVVEALICSGVLDAFNITRRAMKNQYNLLDTLTAKEKSALPSCGGDALAAKVAFLGDEQTVQLRKEAKMSVPNIRRREKLRVLVDNFNQLQHHDTAAQILNWEKQYLGTTISGSLADLKRAMSARNSCIEIGKHKIRPRAQVELCVVVEGLREHTIKTGRNAGQVMAFLTVSDSTYQLDNVCMFSEAYSNIDGAIEPGDVVGAYGVMSDRGLIINSVRRL